MNRAHLAVAGTALAVLSLTSTARAQPPRPAPVPPAPVLLELRINPLMDLHYWVRKLGSEKKELPAVEGLPAAVAAARQVGETLPGMASWGILDAPFTEAGSASELAHVATQLPETFTSRDGKSLPLRQDLAGLATGYQAVEKGFLATVWPGHREVAERAAAALKKELFPKAPAVYAEIARRLDLPLPVPEAPLPIYLVAAAPFPGAFTNFTREGPFSVVALEGEPDSQWVEIVVHETIHALDIKAKEGSVLAELRRRLAQVPGASPQEAHDFVHTVMFVQAADAVRRVLDPSHKDYGDVRGYYGRVGRAATVVVPAWREYLDGKVTRDAAMAKIVAGFAEGLPKKEKGDPKAAPSR
ncbi:MAG TPA: hypothetical protein VF173_35915 [Thermoanaerobaculia bacterium]|nr:hypothetical protein [Thermoanaerobaculia bacterium]